MPASDENHPPAARPDEGRVLPRGRWLLSDDWRSVISTGVTFVFMIGLMLVLFNRTDWLRSMGELELAWFWVLISWAAMTLSHVVLTHMAFRGLSGKQLEAAVLHSPRQTSSRRRRLERLLGMSSDAPSMAAQLSGLAMFGVVALLINGQLRRSGEVLIAAGALVLCCWLAAMLSYALHYAREDLEHGVVAFPDKGERCWDDYLYLSVAVQATFGTTDAAFTSTRGRRAATRHGLLAFCFNTVLIAVMLALVSGS